VNAAVYSEHGKVIKCDFNPGSVERSIDTRRVEQTTARMKNDVKFLKIGIGYLQKIA
jgi:hypothetical protein